MPPKTVTTCTPQTEEGAHVFDIFGYSQYKYGATGVRKPVASCKFSAGEHKWRLLFYSDGIPQRDETFQDNIAVALVLCSKNVKVRASKELRFVDRTTGSPVSVHKSEPRFFEHDSADPKRFYAFFVGKQSVYESSAYLQGDRITVECTVTVIKEPRMTETRCLPKIQVPPSDIVDQFAKLLEEKDGVDVSFIVDGENFTAHKIVLAARSPVFKAELYGPMREHGAAPITIQDMQPAVFRALLHFIYTDSLSSLDDLEADEHDEMIRHLLVATDRYGMERLKLMCQSILCDNLRVQTVAITLALADQHHCDMLKDACVEFITCLDGIDEVAGTQGYKNLKRTCPSVVIEALEKTSRLRKV